MKTILFVFFALWAISLAANAADISGHPYVMDGDTLRIGSDKIRLHGIDAPELSQSCGNRFTPVDCGTEARTALRRIIDRQRVTCEAVTIGKYGRIIGKCYANGIDLQHVMVRSGWAVAYRRYSRDYVVAEDFARREQRGIWQYNFIYPCQHRQRMRNKPVTICN